MTVRMELCESERILKESRDGGPIGMNRREFLKVAAGCGLLTGQATRALGAAGGAEGIIETKLQAGKPNYKLAGQEFWRPVGSALVVIENGRPDCRISHPACVAPGSGSSARGATLNHGLPRPYPVSTPWTSLWTPEVIPANRQPRGRPLS
jgi:hypothetical protein